MLKVFSHCSRVLVNRLPRIGEQAAATADAGVVEQEMDPVGCLLLGDFVAETYQLVLDRDVGDTGGDAQALRQPFHLAQPLGLGHGVGGDIAHRDIAALGNQLARQLAPHARAAPGDDSDLSGKILHGRSLSFPVLTVAVSVGAKGLSASLP